MIQNSPKQTNQNKLTFDDFDKLNLKGFAENLFDNIEQGVISPIGERGAYTISLDAEFGNGKTTFLKMFENFINNEKSHYEALFIDAWKSDFYGEPIIAILSELANYMKKNDENKKIIQSIGKISLSIGNQLIQSKAGIDVQKAIDFLKTGQDLLKNFNHRKEAIEEIKTAVSKYTKDKKLFIIVDELDRTRPDYAVRFLEDMKHFFDIKNVVFLIAVNQKQMQATVKRLYGEQLDFNGYYRKFFKREMSLPDPYKESQKFVDNLIKKTNVKYNPKTKDENYRRANTYYSCFLFKLTLREIEMFIRTFDMILGSENKIANWTYMDCYSFFICLSMKDKKEFNQILSGSFTCNDFLKFVSDKNFKYTFQNESDRIKQKELEAISKPPSVC